MKPFRPDQETVELMARSIHENYRDGHDLEHDHPANKTWDALDDRLKAQNRDQARDNLAKLAEQGIAVVPEDQVGPDDERLGSDELDELVELLARYEHDRWAAQKRAQGYVFGKPRNDDPEKGALLHPDLEPWSELEEPVKEKDRQPIRQIPVVLAGVGLAMVRQA